MAERLTECIDSHLLDNGEMVKEYSLNSKIKLNHFSCMDIPNAVYDKLGELEDIMEKYGIESVEELDKLIDGMQSTINVLLQRNKNTKQDRDTWQKACELARAFLAGITQDNVCDYEDYFYQQAKTEGNDE